MSHPDGSLRATGVRHIYLIKDGMLCTSDTCDFQGQMKAALNSWRWRRAPRKRIQKAAPDLEPPPARDCTQTVRHLQLDKTTTTPLDKRPKQRHSDLTVGDMVRFRCECYITARKNSPQYKIGLRDGCHLNSSGTSQMRFCVSLPTFTEARS